MPHHITIPIFTKTTKGSEAVYFKCIACTATVNAELDHQAEIARGGIGHKCNDCGRHYAIVTATCCNKPFVVDETEWDRLSSGDTVECPDCGEAASLPPRHDLKLHTEYRTTPVLVPLTTHQSESDFVKASLRRLGAEQRESLATHHQSTISRLQLSRTIDKEIQEMDVSSSLNVYNNKDRVSDDKGDVSSEHAVIDKLFLLSNSLVSALDLLAQEINITLNLRFPEERVSYKRIFQDKNCPAQLSDFLKSEPSASKITYLTDLRNICQHRRVPIQATDTKFTVPGYSPLRPMAFRTSPTIYLPDNPAAAPAETTFKKRIEVRSQSSDLTSTVETIVLNTYDYLA